MKRIDTISFAVTFVELMNRISHHLIVSFDELNSLYDMYKPCSTFTQIYQPVSLQRPDSYVWHFVSLHCVDGLFKSERAGKLIEGMPSDKDIYNSRK